MNKINLNLELPLLLAILVLLFFVYMSNKQPGFKFACYILLAGAILLMLFGCSTQRHCQPSKKSKDYARVTRILHDQDQLIYVRAKMYRNEYHVYFKCLPDSIKLGSCVSVTGWEKI